ncbi:MAG: DUF4870 domain-containing protein [Candidatus Aminicenantes bacterium]|jgi:uncharacterized Tic20 family protein
MAKMDPKQERIWGMFCHLSALAVFIFPLFGNIFGPLIVWLVKKDESPFVDDQGKESLNFQITFTICCIFAGILTVIFIGYILLIALGIAFFILVIVAAVKANEGEEFRYPFIIRLVT